jgi:hypothetical protein
MTQHHSRIAQSAYLDLVRSLQDDAVADIRGTPTRLERNGRTYWYDSYRVGSDIRKRYIGEDSPDLRARLARQADLAAERKAREVNRTRLVRVLRAEGMANVDTEAGTFFHALARTGAFRLGATVVGTQAFRLYEGELSVRIAGDDTAQTGDIDIAQFHRLSVALGDAVEETLADTFRDLRFAPVPALKNSATWRWQQRESETLVEFLTPSFTADEPIRDLPALKVSAQSLHFLNFLIAQPIKAAALYRSGILIQIPRPEAYAIHKLIVADRRAGPDRLKARKDLAQADFLIRVLAEDRPGDLSEAYTDAMERGPKWRDHIGASLQRLPDAAARIAAL